jgi:hypothetical protein
VFYYELVRRSYAGTRYSDIASERKDALIALMREGRPAPGNDPFAIIQAKWNELFGRPQPVAEERNPPRADPNLGPAGVVPAGGPPGGGALPPGP